MRKHIAQALQAGKVPDYHAVAEKLAMYVWRQRVQDDISVVVVPINPRDPGPPAPPPAPPPATQADLISFAISA